GRNPRHPYLVLLPVGFAMPSPLPGPRCALAAPFHPCRDRGRGGLLSVALSLGSPPPAVSRHRLPMEPGLSSPLRLPATARPPGQLAWVCLKGRRDGSSSGAFRPRQHTRLHD